MSGNKKEEYIDDYEMEEITMNKSLKQSIIRGLKDAKQKKGRFDK